MHLEYPGFIEHELNDAIVIYDNLSSVQVINTLATHFEVADFEMAM